MSVRKLTTSLLTVLAMMLGGVASVHGQMHHVPPVDPLEFDPDFDWFEPVYDVDLADMKPKKRAYTGWFSTYDRINLYASRPEQLSRANPNPQFDEKLIDSGWGHRYEIGYMLPGDDTGWLFNMTEYNVGAFKTVRQERLNRFVEDGDLPIAPPFGVAVRQIEDNNLGYNFRFYDIQTSHNLLAYDSYELNKTWRLEPYHYGGILEPLAGVRWMRIRDDNFFSNYQSTQGGGGNPPLILPATSPFTDAEQVTTQFARTENEMFGGQLGFRYIKFRDRFTFSSDFRAFFGGNWSNTKSQTSVEFTAYDGAGQGNDVESIQSSLFGPAYADNDPEFYVGFDVRGEIGYQLTKLVSIRAGFQVIDVGRGLWREAAGSQNVNDAVEQDLVMVGGTFGINLNH